MWGKVSDIRGGPTRCGSFLGGMASHILAEPSMGMSPTPKNDRVDQQPV